jgi:hypothetical protein
MLRQTQRLRAEGEERRAALPQVQSSNVELHESGDQLDDRLAFAMRRARDGCQEIVIRQMPERLDDRAHPADIPSSFLTPADALSCAIATCVVFRGGQARDDVATRNVASAGRTPECLRLAGAVASGNLSRPFRRWSNFFVETCGPSREIRLVSQGRCEWLRAGVPVDSKRSSCRLPNNGYWCSRWHHRDTARTSRGRGESRSGGKHHTCQAQSRRNSRTVRT